MSGTFGSIYGLSEDESDSYTEKLVDAEIRSDKEELNKLYGEIEEKRQKNLQAQEQGGTNNTEEEQPEEEPTETPEEQGGEGEESSESGKEPPTAVEAEPSSGDREVKAEKGKDAPDDSNVDLGNFFNEERLSQLDEGVASQLRNLLKSHDKLQKRISSDDGRVAAYQRRYHDVQNQAAATRDELARIKKELAEAQASAQRTPQKTTQPDTSELDADLQLLKETDPALARLIERKWKADAEKISELEARLGTKDTSDGGGYTGHTAYVSEEELAREYAKLELAVPNYQEVINYKETLPDGSVYSPWDEYLHTHPHAQSLVSSNRAEDAVFALQGYGMWLSNNPRYQDYYTNNDAPSVDPSANTNDVERAQAVAKERERKSNTKPVGSSPSANTVARQKPSLAEIYADPELLEKYQQEQMEKELAALGYKDR